MHECGWVFVICSDIANDGEGVSSHDKGVVDVEDDDYSNYAFREPGLNLFDGRVVTGLSLYGQGLYGTLPMEIVLLQHLQVLDLGVRSVVLNSSLPLLNVRLLHLLLHIVVRTANLSIQNNNLQGSIPTKFGKLQRLKKLYLQNNMFEGDIDEVAQLSALTRLIVENNRFTGTLPNDIGKLSRLEEGECIRPILFDPFPRRRMSYIFTSVNFSTNGTESVSWTYSSIAFEFGFANEARAVRQPIIRRTHHSTIFIS